MNPRKRRRIIAIVVGGLALTMTVAVVLVALRDSIVFFVTPTELLSTAYEPGKRLRVGGLVVEGSIERKATATGEIVTFSITDKQNQLEIRYQGALPDLFREGQGAVAEGLYEEGIFIADTILAKHDENYMPREVADALKETGEWRGQ